MEKNINKPTRRLIFIAAEIGEINIVKKLASQYGYTVEDSDKNNLMHYAVRSGNLDLVKLLDAKKFHLMLKTRTIIHHYQFVHTRLCQKIMFR